MWKFLVRAMRSPSGAGAQSDPAEEAKTVPVEKLRRRVDPATLGFADTSELEPGVSLAGQDRALEAIRFGASVAATDFNLFVAGPPGLGKSTAVNALLTAKAAAEPPPADWVYVNNFDAPNKPKAMTLPQGRAQRLRAAMIASIDELRQALPALFESEDYHTRRRAIEEASHQLQEEAFIDLNSKAASQDLVILRTPSGFAIAPSREGKVIKPEIFNALGVEERAAIERKVEALQTELQSLLEGAPRQDRERRRKIRQLNEELAAVVVRQALADVRAEFADLPAVAGYLDAVGRDLIHNVKLFLRDGQEGEGDGESMVNPPQADSARDARFRRYMVNVMVADGADGRNGAPIVEEPNPTVVNLTGRIEHIPQMGALLTDFLLIKPGALHRANGGYLLLDARKALAQPYAWEALKRAVRTGKIVIESLADSLGLISTMTLDPDPIPLKVKAILFGDRALFALLDACDPEFSRLFKVQADFNETLDHTPDSRRAYCALIASIVRKQGLRPVDAGGAARLIEEGARLAEDSEKLSIEVGALGDILREADFCAGEAGRAMIGAADVGRAVAQRVRRADRIRERTQEAIRRNIVLVATAGMKTGQINGLSVVMTGGFSFGRPSRITARVRLGDGRVTDIERETRLGGRLHSKGVMILWGYLAGRFAPDTPLSLAASLVFEQSYGGVDGDSASSAELFALLSALAETPLRQSIAVTGSVNQMGEVQAIGGVNEKIEGFFDACRQRGLAGDQGVIIPAANLPHLMLREDVVEAVAAGLFRVYAIENIDEGLEILTGLPAGARGSDGRFPEGSVNRRAEDRLIALAEARRSFVGLGGGEKGQSSDEKPRTTAERKGKT